MLPRAKADVTELAEMMTSQLEYNPSDEHLDQLWLTAPRFSGPILADALIKAAKCDMNLKLLEELVHTTFQKAQAYVRRVSAHQYKPHTWIKHVQQLALTVVRSVATPAERAPKLNWARAMVAAHFCMGLHTQTACDSFGTVPATRKVDTLWILLSQSTCCSSTSRDFVRRAVNWYGMVTRIAISLTGEGKWQEAHHAMRVHPDLVKEVVSQVKHLEKVKLIDASSITAARREMCMGTALEQEPVDEPGVEEQDAEVDVSIDAGDVMASLLCGEDGEFPLGFESTGEEAAVMLPYWCVEAMATESPDTPPQKKAAASPPRTAKAQGKQKVVSAICKPTVPGYFRVVKHNGALSPPIDLVKGRKAPVGQRRNRQLGFAQSPPKPGRITVDGLLCDESSAELKEATRDWQPMVVHKLVIGANARSVQPRRGALWPKCDFNQIVPPGLTMEHVLGRVY